MITLKILYMLSTKWEECYVSFPLVLAQYGLAETSRAAGRGSGLDTCVDGCSSNHFLAFMETLDALKALLGISILGEMLAYELLYSAVKIIKPKRTIVT